MSEKHVCRSSDGAKKTMREILGGKGAYLVAMASRVVARKPVGTKVRQPWTSFRLWELTTHRGGHP